MPFDHQVDNRRLVEALLAGCARMGVGLTPDRVAAVRSDGDRVTGVGLASGSSIDAAAVVLCAGFESAATAGLPDEVLPPVRPVKGQILRLQAADASTRPLFERTVRALVHGRSCYLVPRADGSLVVGATVEERGVDRTVRAGPVLELLDDARAVVPGVEELELVECAAGLRPGSPDNGPIVGWTAYDRLMVATGHYRNGILQAPLTADTVASLLQGEPPPGVMAAFGPARFAPVRRS
jgi:glycine oxidase